MANQKNRAQVVLTQHQDFIIATGSIEARDDVTLSFESGGSVGVVEYSPGDAVSLGTVIASLGSGTLQADVEAQRLRVNQEVYRLGSFVSGPEDVERSRVEAGVAVSEKMMDSEVHTALVSAQQVANTVENAVRTDFDTLFDSFGDNFRFKVNISSFEKQRISKIREGFEDVFSRWRVWMSSNDTSYKQALTVLHQLEKDLRVMHDGVIEIYDVLLPFRFAQTDANDAFLLSARMRDVLVSSVADIARRSNAVEVARAQYQLAVAQSREELLGSTELDKETQTAQVDIEKEKLRRLELQLGKTYIKAPFDGVVGEVFVTEGEFVSAGSAAVRFVSKEGFNLSVDVTEVEIQDVAVGQDMKAYVGASGDEISVRVRTIDVTEKRLNDVPVYTVIFDVESSGAVLRPGMTVDVYIPSGEATDVFSVPQGAVVKKNSKDYVLIERGGDLMLIPVVVGALLDKDSVAVTGELFVDDVVVFNTEDD